jgi:tripartite-type tricarboxylate transporter receptor subunit TctC
VPYKGTGQSVTDLMAGQIHFVFASMPVVFPHMKSGRLRTLAVTGAKRTPLAPDLPTVAESGIPGYAFDSWWGLVTNTGVPQGIINTLSTEVRRVLQLPDVKDRFTDLGIDVLQSTPAELASFTRSEIERFAKIIRETGIRAD